MESANAVKERVRCKEDIAALAHLFAPGALVTLELKAPKDTLLSAAFHLNCLANWGVITVTPEVKRQLIHASSSTERHRGTKNGLPKEYTVEITPRFDIDWFAERMGPRAKRITIQPPP